MTSYQSGQANQGIPDDEVLAYATANQRSVVTFNRDDFVALHRSGIGHAGIVICKDDRDYLGQAQALHFFYQLKQTHSITASFEFYARTSLEQAKNLLLSKNT